MRTALIRRNPFRLARDPWGFDRFFDGLLGDVAESAPSRAWAPAVDVEQNDNTTVIRADLPGVDPGKMKVSVDDGRLTLEGEREETRESKEGDSHWAERFTGVFRREIALGSAVDASAIEAKYEDGVLTITCPLKAEAQPRKIKVTKN